MILMKHNWNRSAVIFLVIWGLFGSFFQASAAPIWLEQIYGNQIGYMCSAVVQNNSRYCDLINYPHNLFCLALVESDSKYCAELERTMFSDSGAVENAVVGFCYASFPGDRAYDPCRMIDSQGNSDLRHFCDNMEYGNQRYCDLIDDADMRQFCLASFPDSGRYCDLIEDQSSRLLCNGFSLKNTRYCDLIGD